MPRTKKTTSEKEVTEKVETTTSTVAKKEPVKSRKANVVSLHNDKDSSIYVAKRDKTNPYKVLMSEIKKTEFEVGVSYDNEGNEIESKVVHYVGETSDFTAVDVKRSTGYVRYTPTAVKTFPILEFIKAAQKQFCQFLGDGEWTVHPSSLVQNPSLIFFLLRDIDKKYVEDRFSHLLVGKNGFPLTGVMKNKKANEIAEKMSKIRVGNTFISAEGILNIPNFNSKLSIKDA